MRDLGLTAPIALKLRRHGRHRRRIGRHIPVGGQKRLMAEVTGEQHEMVGDGSSAAAPAGDHACGESMPEIVQARTGAIAVADHIASHVAKGGIQLSIAQWPAVSADEKASCQGPMAMARVLIAHEHAHCRGMQRQHPLRTGFCARNLERAGLSIEILGPKSPCLDHAQSRAREQTDDGDECSWP